MLRKLSTLSDNDIEGLNYLLDKWDVKDALTVLSEIDRRISTIEAISVLSSDKNIDELKVLHPLITESRWVFGPEFDSPEYTSNRQLHTVMKKLFGENAGNAAFDNKKKRPDLVVLSDWSMGVTGTESFNSDTNLLEVRQLLLIELKRGGSTLTRANVTQANDYVHDIMGCKELTGNPYIKAYVVGETIADNIVTSQKLGEPERAHVVVTTFGQLVNTARMRLFRLRDILHDRYDDIPGLELVKKSEQSPLF